MTEIHTNNIHSSFAKFAKHFNAIGFGTWQSVTRIKSSALYQLLQWYLYDGSVVLAHVLYQAKIQVNHLYHGDSRTCDNV